jgi:Fur family ferric uptake transcriptional regulator
MRMRINVNKENEMSGIHVLRQRLEGHASRITAPRQAIMEFLSQSSKHLSAKEIYASLHRSYPGLGLSTVYRTLDLLAGMGIVTKLSLGDGQSRYELKSKKKEEHHHHLICTHCGEIINYSEFLEEELRLVKKTEEKLAKKYNFLIQDHNIEFLGICEKCKGKI